MLPVRNPHYVRDWWDSKVSATSISRYQTNGFYLPIPDVSVYASAASFFKPNNTTYNAGFIYLDKNGNEFNPDKSDGEVFKPEKGYQLELGARYELNRMLELNGSVFYIRKHNVVKTIGNKTIENNGAVEEKSVRAQVGREVSKGFDLDLTFRPVSTLEIVGGLGWSDRRTIASNLDWIPEDAGIFYTVNQQVTLAFNAYNLLNKKHFEYTTRLAKPFHFMATVSYRL